MSKTFPFLSPHLEKWLPWITYSSISVYGFVLSIPIVILLNGGDFSGTFREAFARSFWLGSYFIFFLLFMINWGITSIILFNCMLRYWWRTKHKHFAWVFSLIPFGPHGGSFLFHRFVYLKDLEKYNKLMQSIDSEKSRMAIMGTSS